MEKGLQTNPSVLNGQDWVSGCERRLLHTIIGERAKPRAKAPNPSDHKNEFYPINQACLGQIKKNNNLVTSQNLIGEKSIFK